MALVIPEHITIDINLNVNIAGGGVVVTPTPEPTPDPDPTPSPTPTPPSEIEVGSNPFFAGEADFRLPKPDGTPDIYQAVGRGWTPTVRYPNPESPGKLPAFIQRYSVSGTENHRLKLEFEDKSADWGMKATQFFEPGFYAIRQEGYLNVVDGNMDNLSLGAILYTSDGVIEFRRQSFPSRVGDYKIFWYLEVTKPITVEFEVYLRAFWAEFKEAFTMINAIRVLKLSEPTPANATVKIN